MAAEPVERERCAPLVVGLGDERRFAPVVLAGRAPREHGREMRMAVREDRRAHREALADHALDREAAAVDRRLDPLDRDPVGRERGRDVRALARGAGLHRDRRGGPRIQQHAGAGRERERGERDRVRADGGAGWRDARKRARDTRQRRSGIDGRVGVEIRIQRDQQCVVVVFERCSRAAQQHGRARIGCAQLRDLAARGGHGGRASPRIGVGERARQVEPGRAPRVAIAIGLRVARHQRQRHAAFETHRHEPAGADRRRGPQRAPVCALDPFGRRAAPVVREARAVERIRDRDRRADAAQQPVLVDQPRRAQVPPAHRREHGVEARAFELRERVTRVPRHAREQGAVRARAPQRRAPAGPPGHGQVLGRVDQHAGRAGFRERGEACEPPRGQRIARLRLGQVRVGQIPRARRAARVDQRVVARTFDVPVGVRVAQRVVARDPVGHDFEQHAQPVIARGACEPRQRVERVGMRGERVGGAIVVRHVAREPRAARSPEGADQHVVETHCRDVLEQRGPCVERADEAGVAEVDMGSEGRIGIHRTKCRCCAAKR